MPVNLPELKQKYVCWMQGSTQLLAGQASERVRRLDDGNLLNRYWGDRDVPPTEFYSEDIATNAEAPVASIAIYTPATLQDEISALAG